MRWLVVVVVCCGCIQTNTVSCADGTFCPAGTECRQLTNPSAEVCATPDQIAACVDKAPGDPCTTPNTTTGRCYDGVCLDSGCGNGRIDPGEVCDDGNANVGDGCSFECKSNETCGNGIVDPLKVVNGVATSEQCDDANVIGRDGCSGECTIESAVWDLLGFSLSARVAAAATYDVARDRIVMFGGVVYPRQGFFQPPIYVGETQEWDGATWVRTGQRFAPSPRAYTAIAYDVKRHVSVLFGGTNGANIFGETWTWDGNAWRELDIPGPPARFRHAMVYDSVRHKIVLFGGVDRDGVSLGDQWEWDGTWVEVHPANPPSPRSAFGMSFDSKRGVVVVAGGNSGGTTGDTCEFDGTTWRHAAAATPLSITDTSMAFDPTTGTSIVFGGASLSTAAFKWDGTTWTTIDNTGPFGRQNMTIATDGHRSRVIMYGGLYDTGICGSCPPNENDTWSWNGTTWTDVSPASLAPPALTQQSAAFDPIRSRLVMFGGILTGGADSPDTWILDHDLWSQLVGAGPPARHAATMAYDEAHARTVLFGGYAGGLLADTWLFDGVAWSHPIIAGPPARATAGMAYDRASKRVVLYGGTGDTATWEWDGAAWTSHATTLPPLDGPTLGYDGKLGRVVMFGGDDRTTGITSDSMWSWDHTAGAWTKLAPPQVPGGRTTAFAMNHARGNLVVIDGAFTIQDPQFGNYTGFDDDMWEWDGASWHQVFVETRPPRRANNVAIRTADGGGVLVCGGENGSVLSDVWRLRWTGDQPYETCATNSDLDGDGLAGCADPDCWTACTPLCPPGEPCDMTLSRCGDGTCNTALENCRICPQDCGACPAVCGDSICDPPETVTSCPGDCS